MGALSFPFPFLFIPASAGNHPLPSLPPSLPAARLPLNRAQSFKLTAEMGPSVGAVVVSLKSARLSVDDGGQVEGGGERLPTRLSVTVNRVELEAVNPPETGLLSGAGGVSDLKVKLVRHYNTYAGLTAGVLCLCVPLCVCLFGFF